MKMRWLIIVLVALVILSGAGYLAWLYRPEYPKARIDGLLGSLSIARNAKAEVYAPEPFRKGMVYYDSAMQELAQQNQRWFLVRDYSRTDTMAIVASSYFSSASKESQARQLRLSSANASRIEQLNEKYTHFDRFIGWLPNTNHLVRDFTEGRLMLNKAALADENGNMITVNELIEGSEQRMKLTGDRVNKLLQDYFRDYPTWKKMADNLYQWTVAHKKKGILVDKFARKCYLVEKGQITRSYDIELSRNWMGDKIQRGDKTTPEGEYKIVKMKKGKETIYYKACLLDYPNAEDQQRFRELKSQGKIPANANIGGLIEIHGGGGRGIDWTDGCVALKNEDMDHLYGKVGAGTPVYIVGSLRPLGEILEK